MATTWEEFLQGMYFKEGHLHKQSLKTTYLANNDLKTLFKEDAIVGVDNETGNYWDAQAKLKKVGFSQ